MPVRFVGFKTTAFYFCRGSSSSQQRKAMSCVCRPLPGKPLEHLFFCCNSADVFHANQSYSSMTCLTNVKAFPT